ncbi:hypothetical protein [Herbaspirillum robiniae]|uniref:hypothetical protein n=1 Tax=Herbaspirillum robiniae TaxID=2014887 RepID=UPI0013FE49E8|nr:hypothetical protein [Herbaspirillum robiniae]
MDAAQPAGRLIFAIRRAMKKAILRDGFFTSGGQYHRSVFRSETQAPLGVLHRVSATC